jgi:hypothetical protein
MSILLYLLLFLLYLIVALGLNNNELTGPIPVSIGNLTRLEYLGLNNNELTGPIPDSIGKIIRLVDLGLNNNELTGPIPVSIGNLTSSSSNKKPFGSSTSAAVKPPPICSSKLICFQRKKRRIIIKMEYDRDNAGNILHYVSINRSMLKLLSSGAYGTTIKWRGRTRNRCKIIMWYCSSEEFCHRSRMFGPGFSSDCEGDGPGSDDDDDTSVYRRFNSIYCSSVPLVDESSKLKDGRGCCGGCSVSESSDTDCWDDSDELSGIYSEDDTDVYRKFFTTAVSSSSSFSSSSSSARTPLAKTAGLPAAAAAVESSSPQSDSDIYQKFFTTAVSSSSSSSSSSARTPLGKTAGLPAAVVAVESSSPQSDSDVYEIFLTAVVPLASSSSSARTPLGEAASLPDVESSSSPQSVFSDADDGDDSTQLSGCYSDDEDEDADAALITQQRQRRRRTVVCSKSIDLAGITCQSSCKGRCLATLDVLALNTLREKAHSTQHQDFLTDILEKAFCTKELSTISFKGKIYNKKAGALTFTFDELSAPICENATLLYLNLFLPNAGRRQPKRLWRELRALAKENLGRTHESKKKRREKSKSKEESYATKLIHAEAFISNYVLNGNKVDTSPFAGEENTLIIPYKRLSYFYGEYEQTHIEIGLTRKQYASLNTFGRAFRKLKYDLNGYKLSFSNGKGSMYAF